LEPVAKHVAADLQAALGVDTTLTIYRSTKEKLEVRRRLAEKTAPQPWDILLLEQGPQAADVPPLELHRAFVGATGEWRAGPISSGFEALYGELIGETSRLKLARISYRIDKFVRAEALALFLCAPQALYAVNKHVDFTPYRTTFELAQTKVSKKHWSRR
jgi:peptide/nickel transport system substrate-binding protein